MRSGLPLTLPVGSSEIRYDAQWLRQLSLESRKSMEQSCASELVPGADIEEIVTRLHRSKVDITSANVLRVCLLFRTELR